jgi:hypothetical protein
MMEAHAGLTEESRRMITALEMTGNFRVLRRFSPREKFAEYESENARAKAKIAMVLASRATSAAVTTGRTVMLSYVLVRFNPETGVVYEVDSVYAGTEDPGAPISESVERAIGATDVQLSGSSFDMTRINEDIARSSVIVCHSAEVERKFLEERFEGLAAKWFISSGREFPWGEFGASSRSLDVLVSVVAGVFYNPGPPLLDAQVLVDLLSRKARDERQVLKVMLEVSRVPHWRIWAIGTSQEHRRKLFDRDYKLVEAFTLDKKPIKGWSKVVRNLESEVAYLGGNVYGSTAEIQAEKITGFERYTDRPGQGEPVTVTPQQPAKPSSSAESGATTGTARSEPTGRGSQEPAGTGGPAARPRPAPAPRPAPLAAPADSDFPI